MNLYDTFASAVEKVNVYDIFGYCYGLPKNQKEHALHHERGLTAVNGQIKSYKKSFTAADYTPWARYRQRRAAKNGGVGEVPPCVYGDPLLAWMNQADVRKAMHIPDSYPAWDMCSGTINYTPLQIGSQWIYESLKGQYRMIHFSGDTDGAVPTDGTIAWIETLNRTVKAEMRPYFVKNEPTPAGYITEYDGLTFATVHGAGHMAPQFKPKETFHLIFNWINRTPI